LLGIQEEETASAEHPRPLAPTKHPPVATTTNKQTNNAAPAGKMDWPKKHGTDDFNRERQLRDFCRANNLCFKCGDKYSKDHQCKRSGQLLAIEVGEFGEVLSDELVLALELLHETPVTDTCCHISLEAAAGAETPN
jgi:hypothetical protein